MLREQEQGLVTADSFEDIKQYYEELFLKGNIKALYKIRNWRERFHPDFLKSGELYFARPNELNDPFDVSRPVKFNASIIETADFFNSLVAGAIAVRGINPGSDAETYAKNHLSEIRKDPSSFFLDNYKRLIKQPVFNNGYGIFSLSLNVFDEQLWGYYGGGLKGFAVGFEPIGLCEELFVQGDFVDYTDEIRLSNVINRTVKEASTSLFQKNKKWQFESEFRFVKRYPVDHHYQIDHSYRKHYFSPKIVREIILGPRTPKEDEDEILDIADKRYSHAKKYRLVCDYHTAKMYLEAL